MASLALRRFTVVLVSLVFALPNGVAFAAPGDLLWVGRYEQGFRPGVWDMAASADRVFALIRAPKNELIITVAFDRATGEEVWSRVYKGSISHTIPTAIEVAPDGGTVFVAGLSVGTSTLDDFVTIAYDAATGIRRWIRRYDGGGTYPNDDEFPRGLAVSRTGTVFVTGGSYRSETQTDFATVAYDGATGTRLWVQRFDWPESGIDEAYAIATSPNGSRVFVTGSTVSQEDRDFLTLAYDAATGARLWENRFVADGADTPISIGVDPSGDAVFITGLAFRPFPYADDFLTVALDVSTGSDLWASRYPASALSASVAASVVSATGDVFVAGFADEGMTTIGYDGATGAELWTVHRDDVYAVDLAVRPDGTSIFVLTYNAATISYDAATGAQEWMTTYSGGETTGGTILAPGGGAFYVGAQELGADRDQDALALAYDIS